MPPDTELPVPTSPATSARGAEETSEVPNGASGGVRPEGGDPEWRRLVSRAGGVLFVAAMAGSVALGVAGLLGEGFREAVLVEVETRPEGSVPSYSDAPREAATFFADRDTVRVEVMRDMTVADFLALHHLGNNPGAHSALREQLGVGDPADLLREGDRVTLPLTVRRDPVSGGAGAREPGGRR